MNTSKQVDHLPLQSFGLQNIPAVPYWPSIISIGKTLLQLTGRELETEPAKHGLSISYICGQLSSVSPGDVDSQSG